MVMVALMSPVGGETSLLMTITHRIVIVSFFLMKISLLLNLSLFLI